MSTCGKHLLWHSIALQFYPFVQQKNAKIILKGEFLHISKYFLFLKSAPSLIDREKTVSYFFLFNTQVPTPLNNFSGEVKESVSMPFLVFFSALLQFSTPNLACTMFHHNVFARSTPISTPHSCHIWESFTRWRCSPPAPLASPSSILRAAIQTGHAAPFELLLFANTACSRHW